jgi:hypothetical protein
MSSELGTLTHGEGWLLETAVECRCPIPFLTRPEPDLSEALNYKGHGLSQCELFAAFRTLRDQEYITFYNFHSDEPVALSDEELFASLAHGAYDSNLEPVVYGLTPAGGARWETTAEADWSRFYEGFSHEAGGSEDQRVLTAGSLARLHELLDHHTGFLYEEIVAGSVIEDIVRPWEATYWKTLPVGFRVRCWVKSTEPHWAPQPPDWKATYRAFVAWYRFTWHGGWGGLEPALGARSDLCS